MKSSGVSYVNRDISPDLGVTRGKERDYNSANNSPSSSNGQATHEARSRRAMKRVRYKANQRQNEAKIYQDYECLQNWNPNLSSNQNSNAEEIKKGIKIQEAAPGSSQEGLIKLK